MLGDPPNCDDDNVCTLDGCDEILDSCVHEAAAAQGQPCDDGFMCTIDDVCDGNGNCMGMGLPEIMDVVDFEGFMTGAPVTTVFGVAGTGPVTVKGLNPVLGAGPNAAVIYDSSCIGGCSGDDADIGTPNKGFGGPGMGSGGLPISPFANSMPQGNVLIVAENLTDANFDGLVDEPDDQSLAVVMLTFDFTEVAPATLHQLAMIDVDVRCLPVDVDHLLDDVLDDDDLRLRSHRVAAVKGRARTGRRRRGRSLRRLVPAGRAAVLRQPT